METSNIVKELREFLDSQGVTAAELARVSGISPARISYLRNGKRKDCSSESATALRRGMEILRAETSGVPQ